ncbi:hypothetical protein ACR6C2_17580 [Streptomyces sp. INA 01156]
MEQFRRLFWFMLVLAVPVVGFNGMFAHLVGYDLPEAGWVRWISRCWAPWSTSGAAGRS